MSKEHAVATVAPIAWPKEAAPWQSRLYTDSNVGWQTSRHHMEGVQWDS